MKDVKRTRSEHHMMNKYEGEEEKEEGEWG